MATRINLGNKKQIGAVSYAEDNEMKPSTVEFYDSVREDMESVNDVAFAAYNCQLNNSSFNVKKVRPNLIEQWHRLQNGIPYIELFLNNFHSCYDLVLNFSEDVENPECILMRNLIGTALTCTRISARQYTLSDYTIYNQLIGIQDTPTSILIKYDNIKHNSPIVNVTGKVCYYKNLGSTADKDSIKHAK